MDLSSPRLTYRQASASRNAAVALIGLTLTTLALYHETVVSLVQLWIHSYTYQHGLLLVAVCGFLFYRRWVEVGSSMQIRPSSSAAVLILLVSLVWLLASLVHVLIVQQLSLALILALLIVSVVGYRSAWLFAVPVSLLVFALPVWDLLVPYLQALTANAATILLNLTGIPAVHQGNQIWVPAGTFAVIPACSGISQLIVGTAAGALFAYINRLGRKTAIWVVGGAAGVSLLSNALRVYATVLIGQLSGMQHYLVTQHWAPAWVLFGILAFIFFHLASRWTRPSDQPPSAVTAQAAGSLPAGNASVIQSALLSVTALLVGSTLGFAFQTGPGEIGRLALNLPAEMGGWRAVPTVSRGFRPVFQSADLEYERLYRHAQGGAVYLYVAEYTYQDQGKEAVSNVNRVYGDQTWQPVATSARHLGEASVQETRIQSGAGAEKLVWQWYYVHGFAVGSDYMAKLLNVWGMLNRDPAITAVVVATDLNGSYETTEAEALLRRFLADTKQTVEDAIDHSR